MKLITCLQVILIAASFLGVAKAQLPVLTQNIDPSTYVNDYVSIGEWKTSGNLDGWARNAAAVAPLVASGGLLEVTTTGGDPNIARNNFAPAVGTNAELIIVEVNLRMLEGTGSGWEMFWGTTEPGQGSFSGARRIGYTLDVPLDGQFHAIQFDFTGVMPAGVALRDFRIDCGADAGNKFQIDYVRIGRVMPDTDVDGLPDVAETKTGVFLSRRNAGTDPAKADTDSDGVPDGVEVDLGTDPNDPTAFPVPTLDRYELNPAIYVINVAISPNTPTVTPLPTTGPATNFVVQPALPAGLVLAPATGIISGTPTAATAAMDYTVIVTFQNSATATNSVNIEVRQPYIVFATADLKRTLKVNQDLGAGLTPLKIGGVDPISYSIDPLLPDGLLFDTNTGTISGAGTLYSPLTTNIVTAKYSSYPDWKASVILSVLEAPIVTSDPTELLLSYVSWGEFSDPADTNGWFFNGIAPFYEIVDGAMTVTTTGGDPYFGKNGTLATDFRILEIRAKIVSAGAQTGFRTYWSENAPNRGMSEATSFPFTTTADDQYHVYQLDYRKATEGSFNGLRLDTGDGAGMTLYLDYWRFGSFDPSLKIAALANGSLRLSWPNVAAGFVLWSTASLAGGWALDGGVVTTEGNESVVIAQPGANPKFYRLKK